MTWLVVAALVIALLVVILLSRHGIAVQYDADGLKVDIFLGPVKIKLLPRQKGKEKRQKKSRKSRSEKKPTSQSEPQTERGGKVQLIKDIYAAVRESLYRFRKKLLVNELIIRYQAAGSDPAKVAMMYGYANAAAGAVIPMLEQVFRIKKRSVSVTVDFTTSQPLVFVRLKLSLSILELIYIVAGLDIKLLKTIINGDTVSAENTGKVEMNNG